MCVAKIAVTIYVAELYLVVTVGRLYRRMFANFLCKVYSRLFSMVYY